MHGCDALTLRVGTGRLTHSNIYYGTVHQGQLNLLNIRCGPVAAIDSTKVRSSASERKAVVYLVEVLALSRAANGPQRTFRFFSSRLELSMIRMSINDSHPVGINWE